MLKLNPTRCLQRELWAIEFALLSLLPCLVGCSDSSNVAELERAGDIKPVSASTQVQAVVQTQPARRRRQQQYLQHLSDYNLYQEPIANLEPAADVIAYDVNTPLFSDYAGKHRVVGLPAGTSASYRASEVFDFPVGTVIAKTFYYNHDMNDPAQGRRLVETRILIHQQTGWIGLPYLWDDQQTDAKLSLVGGAVDVAWMHTDGNSRANTHLVPNFNDCKRCHQNEKVEPIGPRARSLNRDFVYDHGSENQLDYWTRTGLLTGAPASSKAPRLAVWNDASTGTLDQRARAWLEVNCAHCHSPIGPARNSGLHLHADVSDPYRLGIFKTPVAAGRGTGGRLYDLVPGQPDASILMYRLQTDHVGEMMPEFGRSLVDEEAVALIRQWIEQLESPAETKVSYQR